MKKILLITLVLLLNIKNVYGVTDTSKSSIVMDIYGSKKNVDEFVPAPVARLLYSLNK